MKKSRFLVVILFATALIISWAIFESCKSVHDENKDSIQQIQIGDYNSREVGYSQVFKKLEYIQLETNEECLLPDIDQIEIADDRFFLFSNSRKTIYIFNRSGKYLSKIHNIGKGPNEMIGPTDFAINSESQEVLWLDNYLCKIFVYDYYGNCKGSFNSLNRTCFAILDKEKYLFYNHLYHYNYKNFEDKTSSNLVAISDECEILKNYSNEEFPEFLSYTSRRALHKTQLGEIFFQANYGRTIYSIDDELSLCPEYQISFEKDLSLIDVRKLKNEWEFNQYINENKLPSIIDRLFINSNYVYFVFLYDHQSYHQFYNRDTGASFNVAYGKFIDDVNGITSNAFYNATKKGLLGLIQMQDVIEAYNRNNQEGVQMKQKNQIRKIVESSDEYDNPILVLAEYI